MNKKIFAAVLAGALAVSVTGCGSSQSAETTAAAEKSAEAAETAAAKETSGETGELRKITFVLDWTPNTNHTGLYVAQAKGYFADAGLDVEIVQPPEGGAEVLVASGKAEFCVGFQDTVAPALVGDAALPIKAVAAVIQHNTSGIISRKGEGMDTPKGMEGKKYATWESPVELATLKSVVEQDGGDFSKIQLIPSNVTDEVSALRSKSVDAIWIFYGWAGVKTELEGLETDYFEFADIDPVFDYYTPVILSGTKFLEEEPETAKAFLAALKKGYEDAIADPEEAADILCEAAPELDHELVLASQKYLANEYKAEVEQWGYIDPERWNRFYRWLNENGLIEPELPDDFGFTNDYLPQ